MLLLLTGPAAGCLTGPVAAGVQLYWESVLHHREPRRFPPTPLDALAESRRRMRAGATLADVHAAQYSAATFSRDRAVTASYSAGDEPPLEGMKEAVEQSGVQLYVAPASAQARQAPQSPHAEPPRQAGVALDRMMSGSL